MKILGSLQIKLIGFKNLLIINKIPSDVKKRKLHEKWVIEMTLPTWVHFHLPFLPLRLCIVMPDVALCVSQSQDVAYETKRYWKETGIQGIVLLKQSTS